MAHAVGWRFQPGGLTSEQSPNGGVLEMAAVAGSPELTISTFVEIRPAYFLAAVEAFLRGAVPTLLAYYEGIGIGPWQDYPPLSQFTDLDVPNPEAFSHMKYRYVDLESVQVQLCEPPKLDCPQRRFLDTRGEGVFHIGFEADLDTAISQAQESGLDLIMSGRRDNGTGFAYFDTLDQAGVVWMCRQTKPLPS